MAFTRRFFKEACWYDFGGKGRNGFFYPSGRDAANPRAARDDSAVMAGRFTLKKLRLEN